MAKAPGPGYDDIQLDDRTVRVPRQSYTDPDKINAVEACAALTDDEIALLRSVFSLLDGDEDGLVDGEDMQRVVLLLGSTKVAANQLRRIFQNKEAALRQGSHNFNSFTRAVVTYRLEHMRWLILRVRTLRDIFSLFDRAGAGTIAADDLARTLTQQLGWRPTRYESERLLATVDEDGDNCITFVEFVTMYTGKAIPVLGRIKAELSELMVRNTATLYALQHRTHTVRTQHTVTLQALSICRHSTHCGTAQAAMEDMSAASARPAECTVAECGAVCRRRII